MYLITGAGGGVGSVSRTVVELLLDGGERVRAMVHRDDERAQQLRALGADVVVGDLTRAPDIVEALAGVRRMFFNMSVSADYLLATAEVCAVALERGHLDALVNMSQMTVSQMSIHETTPSHQQRQHWLGEQALAWSGLPVVTVRPTMFAETFLPLAAASVRERSRIELPFGLGKTSPVAAADVARVVAAILADPAPHLGRVYELTGPRSEDMHAVAREFSEALGRDVTYADVPPDAWARALAAQGVPEHLAGHLVTMAALHRAGRYDRLTDGVERVTGRPATSIREFVALHADAFGGRDATSARPPTPR
jgi:uncharacterized protein YbjT (DUF2867 family)